MNDEDIKVLEELKISLSKNLERLNDSDISTTMFNIFSLRKQQAQAIENLLKENKELSEENAILKRANNISEDVKIEDITKFINKSIEDFNKEYIPVAKIEEKMKESEKTLLFENLEKWEYEYLQGRKKAYKELLEGK